MDLAQTSGQIWSELQNFTIIGTLSIILIPCITIFFLRRSKRTSKLNLPPSPPKLPIIGNLHQLGKLPHRSLQALSKKYGPIMLMHLGQTPTLVLSSPDLVKEMTKDHDIAFSNRHVTTAANILAYHGTDVGFAPYGESWRQARKACVIELLSLKRVHSFQYVRTQENEVLVDKIRRVCRSDDGGLVDLTEALGDVSNNIASRCVLGKKFDGDGDINFGELSRKITMQFASFSFGDFFPSLGWLDLITGLVSKLKETFNQIDSLLDQVIDEHKHPYNMDTVDMDFIDILLKGQKNDMLSFDLTRDKLKAILMDMFVGGTDTTATLTEWTMAELVKNPTTLKKVQEEVRRVVGHKSTIDENDMNQMGYLKCVIKESLRLHPPLPLLIPRETSVKAKLGGYDIPPKTNVLLNTWAIQHDPQQWDMPEKFIPERFEVNKTVDYKGQDFQFIPFGVGRRGCPGISFGVTSGEYTLANLLHWFDWGLPSGMSLEDLDMSEVDGLTVHKKNHLLLVPTMYPP